MNLDAPEKTNSVGSSSQVKTILFFLIALVFIAARLWRLTASCLWFDEIFSVHAARHSWGGMLSFAAADIIHPPLFYAVLKIWIAIGGESLTWLRLLPLLISVITIPFFWLLCRELKLTATETNFAFLLMSLSGFLVKYAQEVRMYSLLLLLSVISVWLFMKLLRRESASHKQIGLLIGIDLLLVYTHYYGWLVVVVESVMLILLARKQLKSFLFGLLVMILAYAPWIYAVATFSERGHGLSQNLGWIARPGLLDVAQFFIVLGQPFEFSQSSAERAAYLASILLVLLIFAIPILILGRQIFRARASGKVEVSLLAFAFVPVIFAFVLSWSLPYPIWGTRHLIICAVPCFVLASMALLRLRLYWLKAGVILILACWFFLAGAVWLLKPRPMLTWCAWEELVRQMPASAGSSSQTQTVYAFEELVAYHVWFAGTKPGPARLKVAIIKGVPGAVEDPAFFLPRRFDEIKVGDQTQITGEHIWIAFRAPRGDEVSGPQSVANYFGYRVGTVLTVNAQGERAFLVELWRQ